MQWLFHSSYSPLKHSLNFPPLKLLFSQMGANQLLVKTQIRPPNMFRLVTSLDEGTALYTQNIYYVLNLHSQNSTLFHFSQHLSMYCCWRYYKLNIASQGYILGAFVEIITDSSILQKITLAICEKDDIFCSVFNQIYTIIQKNFAKKKINVQKSQ